MMRLGERSKGMAIYTILWAICALFIVCIFQANGKAFFWMWDGIYQHFASFHYLCEYSKDLIYNGHFAGFYNFTLGQGMDILTTLSSYDFTDPVSIFCALMFPLSEITRYSLMVFIKLYLIGLAFIFYCHTIGREEAVSIAAGALAYVFSGAILFMFLRHPNFINWGYFFPFLLGGVELYLRKKKKVPLVLFVFLNIVTSYYTFYIDAILVGIYVLVHAVYNIIGCRNSIYAEGRKILELVGVCSIGVLLSAFIFFPIIYAFLNNARIAELTGYTASAWHYPSGYYKKLIEYIFSTYRSDGYTEFIGLNTVIIVPLILLFMKKEKHIALKSLLIISFLMICIPLAGRIMNGFSYASNRWAFAIPFYASVAFVIMFADMNEMSRKEKISVCFLTFFYIFLCLLDKKTNTDLLKYSALVMLAVMVMTVEIVQRYKRSNFIMLFLVFLGACFQVYILFGQSAGNYTKTFFDKSDIESRLKNWSSIAAPKPGDHFYRVEMEETRTNTTGYTGVNGTGFWWSIVPAYVRNYYADLALDSIVQNCNAYNLDGRARLLALASTKYYTLPNKKTGFIPYGYREISSLDKRYQVFENQYALPIGYTYSGYTERDTYRQMNGIEKEQVLMQSAVLERSLDNYTKIDATVNYNVLDYEIIKTKKVTVNDGSIKVNAKNGIIVMNTIVPDDSEIYVYIKGVELKKGSSRMFVKASREKDDYLITKFTDISNSGYNWTVIRDDVAFNLGSGHPGINTITLIFGNRGTISYDNIDVIAVPMNSYVVQAKKLGEYVLKNVNVANDKVMGTISIPDNRILHFSIPYSNGWEALVDGKETTILISNIMYMALPLAAGNHTIELTYKTPYLREGIMVTGSIAFLWALYEFLRRRKHHLGIIGDNLDTYNKR